MPSFTIANINLDFTALGAAYNNAKALFPADDFSDLDLIFQIACRHKDRFPNVILTGAQSPERYIERWVRSYHDAANNPPSRRTASPKSSCTDPAIKTIVMVTKEFDEEAATFGETTHNLFMSAENIQGNLLEEYIASRTRAYGFLWCMGNVLRAVDFCTTDGSLFLQVKNKNNTENSSSSSIREGTPIEKWYRLGTRTVHGVKQPDYKWELLNAMINASKTKVRYLPPCNMTEADYQMFLRSTAQANPRLITDK